MTNQIKSGGELKAQRDVMNEYEQMMDAQNGCAPCKLCDGKAILSDAGPGAGYYIRCENSGAFRAAMGCMVTDQRLGGWAYNVMDWWNRLHASRTPAKAGEDGVRPLKWTEPKPPCEECRYDHCTAETPFGQFRIQWKSWKNHPGYVIYFAEDFVSGQSATLEEAKTEADKWFLGRFLAALHGERGRG